MARTEHETYAKDLLLSLADDHPEMGIVNFAPNPMQSRNAAKAMTAILCHRIFRKSGRDPIHKAGTTYEWMEGVFNCRNITDRDYLWTNMRRKFADEMHEISRSMSMAYLLACSQPSDATVYVWAIPEPLLHDSLSSLPLKEAGPEYTIQIRANQQRIEHYAASPDLTLYFHAFTLSGPELRLLEKSREVDDSVKRERAIARGDEDTDDNESASEVELDARQLLATSAQQLNDAGGFDPNGIADARERIASSIVRRRGQPAFRHHLLTAYNGRCAITGCNVESVLDAAHIVPYRGPDTNHPANGCFSEPTCTRSLTLN